MNDPDGSEYKLHFPTTYDPAGLDALEKDLKRTKESAESAAVNNPMAMPPEMLAERTAAREEETRAIEETTAATDDLVAAQEAEAQALREADVERAKSLQSQRRHEESLARIEENTRRLIAVGLGQTLNDVARELRGVNKEQDLMADGLSAMAAGLQTGNPYVAIGVAAMEAGKAIWKAFDEAKKIEQQVEEQARATDRTLREFFENRKNAAAEAELVSFFDRETAALDKQARALERSIELLNARAASQDAVREAEQKLAASAGADPAELARGDRGGDIESRMAQIERDLEAARARAGNAADRSSTASGQLFRARASTSAADGEMIDELQRKADEAAASAEEAQADVAQMEQLAEQYRATVLAEATVRVNEATDAAAEGITTAAEEALAQVRGLSDENTRFFADRVQKLIEDATPDAAQEEQITQALQQLREAAGRKDQELFKTISDILETTRGGFSEINRLKSEQADLRRQLREIQQKTDDR